MEKCNFVNIIILEKSILYIIRNKFKDMNIRECTLNSLQNYLSSLADFNKIYINLLWLQKYFSNMLTNLNEDSNNVDGSSYKQILSTLSNEYTYFRNSYVKSNIRNILPELITEKTPQVSITSKESQMNEPSIEIPESRSETGVSDSQPGESDSQTTLFSSLTINKLIPIPFIFAATLILLGIAYKYSLFGFRKRSKKHLREQIKK
ncbi:hypothetical protein YYC_01137 [Plasmodium yoelii 17X]|uniref:Uncharacterized protein n=1 Tax=Plasmodium yoelii 17X TaxID=1323249 RepID=V7PSU6_PLAYE|nr:hypothetical protein YYC_01137 [Plasmodium yoelii 17X]